MPDQLDMLLQQINELNFEAGEIHVCQKTKQGAAFQVFSVCFILFLLNFHSFFLFLIPVLRKK